MFARQIKELNLIFVAMKLCFLKMICNACNNSAEEYTRLLWSEIIPFIPQSFPGNWWRVLLMNNLILNILTGNASLFQRSCDRGWRFSS